MRATRSTRARPSANYGGANNHRDPGVALAVVPVHGAARRELRTATTPRPLWNCTTDKTEAVRCNNGKVEIDHCTAGCESKPIGTDDVCNHTDAGGRRWRRRRRDGDVPAAVTPAARAAGGNGDARATPATRAAGEGDRPASTAAAAAASAAAAWRCTTCGCCADAALRRGG